MDLRRSSARPLNQGRSPWQNRCQIFSQLALEAAEKNHVEAECIGADSSAHGLLSNLYFTVYVILNSLVILSLFVGVICTGMFVAFGAGTS